MRIVFIEFHGRDYIFKQKSPHGLAVEPEESEIVPRSEDVGVTNKPTV